MNRRGGRLVDLTVDRWLTETDKAWLLIVNGKRVWLAKSQCEFDEDEGIVTMPESQAIDKELV